MGKNVVVSFSKLARVDLVKELHEDEGLEDDCVHEDLGGRLLLDPTFSWVLCNLFFGGIERIRLLVGHVEDFTTLEHKDEQDDNLIDGLTNNVSPHDRVDDGVRLVGGLSKEDRVIGRFGSQGKGSEGVHDQVHPKHLG